MSLQKEQVMALDPQMFADHLRRAGWREQRKVPGKGTIWLFSDREGRQFEIMLPTNRKLGDFAIRMGEALRTLAIVEEKDTSNLVGALANGVAASGTDS